jgi:hypothetical protein
MFPDLTTQAINAALVNNWDKAIEANLTILKENANDIAALNRLAWAYKESGRLKLALDTYCKVLKIDRFNPIALKNLKLIEDSPKKAHLCQKNNNHPYEPEMFLEEPGKTKVVRLVNLAPASILFSLSPGYPVNLEIKRRTVTVVNDQGTYLGALPDDLSCKLIRLIKGGNQYAVVVRTVAKNGLDVFIRERCRSQRFKNQPTFPGLASEEKGKTSQAGSPGPEEETLEPLEEKTSEESPEEES